MHLSAGDAAINMVVAIPEALTWDGEERLSQNIKGETEEAEINPIPHWRR